MAGRVADSPGFLVHSARPIVKWAGGKGQMLGKYAPYCPVPEQFDSYLEPFVGGGALFFDLAPRLTGKLVWLNDANAELINLYRVVKTRPRALIQSLREHAASHSEAYYYQVRARQPEERVERAGRFLYLNKTCYNGLYRVNAGGRFNVPVGRYSRPAILDEAGLWTAHRVFKKLGVLFQAGDFDCALSILEKRRIRRALVYIDPPYQRMNETAYFTSYTPAGFDENDQRRLAVFCHRLKEAGHLVMVSNSYHALIAELYKGFRLIRMRANRFINCRADRRGPVFEYLILGYPPFL